MFRDYFRELSENERHSFSIVDVVTYDFWQYNRMEAPFFVSMHTIIYIFPLLNL